MKKLLKLFKIKKNFAKRRGGLWTNINFYWKLAVTFMFIVFAVSFFFGYRLFLIHSADADLSSEGGNGQIKTIKKERIDKVLQYFSDKEKKSNEILNSPSPLSDPSL